MLIYRLISLIILLLAYVLSSPVFCQQMDLSIENEVRQHVNRGNQLMSQKQYSSAMAEYEAARSADPKNSIVIHNIAECHNNWGILFYRQKAFKEAVSQFEKCLATNPQHNQARFNINLCRQAMTRAGISDKSDNETEDNTEKNKKSDKDKKDSEEEKAKDESAPKIISSPGGPPGLNFGSATLFGAMRETPAAGSYVTGTAQFPTYSSTPSAFGTPVMSMNTANQTGPLKTSATQLAPNTPIYVPGQASSPVVAAQSNPSSLISEQTHSPAQINNPEQAETANKNNLNSEEQNNASEDVTKTEPLEQSKDLSQAEKAILDKEKVDKERGDQFDSFEGEEGKNEKSEKSAKYEKNEQEVSKPSNLAVVDKDSKVSKLARSVKKDSVFSQEQLSEGESSSSAQSIEEKISILEIKINGKKNSGTPIVKRLEDLEVLTFGKSRKGTLNERLDFLCKHILH